MLETILIQGFCPHKIEITHFANGFCLVTSLSRKVMQTNTQNSSVEVYYVHVTFDISSSDLTTCTVSSMCIKEAMFEPLFCFFFFVGNVNKREYLKTYSLLKFSEIWQKSCSY